MAAPVGRLKGGRDRRGQLLLVRYQGHPHYHQRLVLGNLESSNDELMIISQDFDRYMEMFGRDHVNITSVVWANLDGTRPVGLPANTQIYRFAAWPDDLQAQWYQEAPTRCRETDRRRGLVPAAVAAVAAGAAVRQLGSLQILFCRQALRRSMRGAAVVLSREPFFVRPRQRVQVRSAGCYLLRSLC